MRTALRVLNAVPAPIAARFRTGTALARFVRPVVNAVLPNAATVATIRSGFARGLRFELDPRAEKYYWTGTYELRVQEELARLLHPGGCFWDVGAHAGFHSLIAARLVAPSGEVHAIEPVPANTDRIRRNAALNSASVFVHEVAVGASSGRVGLVPHPAGSMWRTNADRGGSLQVEATTLDELALGLRPPTVIKIDVEGAELDVLRGAVRLIEQRRPALIVELFDGRMAADALALLPGYSATRLDEHNYRLDAGAGR